MQAIFKSGLLAIGSVAILAGLAGPAEAGRSYGMGFSCGVTNNLPRCSGSMRGARMSAGSDDYAYFRMYSPWARTGSAPDIFMNESSYVGLQRP